MVDDDEENYPIGNRIDVQSSEEEQYADPDEDLISMEIDGDEEIDSDEAFESGDETKFQGYKFGGSRWAGQDKSQKKPGDSDIQDASEDADSSEAVFEGLGTDSDQREDDEEDDVTDHIEQDSTEDPDDSESDGTSISEDRDEEMRDDRAAIRKMMAEEQKTVAESLSKAAKADIEKGRAVKRQRTIFDNLLNTRIKLQKALVATNSMSASTATSSVHTSAIQAAESAALSLWNNLSSLRSSLQDPESKKAPLTATISTSSSNLWQTTQAQETVSLPDRHATLTKWSQKTNPAASLPRANRFSQTPTQKPLTSILDQHLSSPNYEKFLLKTQTPRSCAPLQAAARTSHDPTIYDDADFYTLLLRELVDQRMADPSSTSSATALPNGNTGLRGARDVFKVKKQVDTKASKGRKMRYTVHEKLQNFMAPEDRGTWGERQRNELFGSLLGRKAVALGEDGVESEEEEVAGMDGRLRLFG